MPTATLNIIINSIFEKVKDFGKLFLRYFISFCSARGVRAKFFRVSALRPPLPCLRQILFFALADFFKISVLDRFFFVGVCSHFFIFPSAFWNFPNHSLSRFFFSNLLTFHDYIIHLFYYLVNTFLLNLFSFLCYFIIFLCRYII